MSETDDKEATKFGHCGEPNPNYAGRSCGLLLDDSNKHSKGEHQHWDGGFNPDNYWDGDGPTRKKS